MLTFHVIPLFLVIASEVWNLKVCACAMILDSSLRSATFRMTECQHYLVRTHGRAALLKRKKGLIRACQYSNVSISLGQALTNPQPVGLGLVYVNDQELGTGRSRNNQDL